jgi:nucleoid-associated protein YgaU
MAVTTNKALLFLTGGVAAAAVVAYGAGAFDPLLKRSETIAALPEAGQADKKDARLPGTEQPAEQPAQPSAPEAAKPAAPEAAKPAAPEAPAAADPEKAGQPPVVPPSFDVVRVEGDGSIVIAGKAAPDAKVDLLVGSNVIGSATAGDDGDFAVVLDDPLKPGDYQIVLRATAPENVVAMSVETAVVSVPDTPEGQVLALVEEPGKPSQMITVPQPQAPAAAAKPPEAAAPLATETPPAAAKAPAEAKPEPEQEQAALPEQAEPAAPPPAPPPAGPMVRVEAVEIDGRKIFVAGAADPGRVVRGYANEILLGDAKASPDGRYLIEADRNLPVGDYIIRVDALEPDGVKVAARAAVPFEREPGETIAAVAPPPPAAPPPAAAAPAPDAAAPAGPPAAAGTPAKPEAPATAQGSSPQPPPAGAEAPAAPAPPEPPAASAETPPASQPPAASGAGTQAAKPPAAEAPAAVTEAPPTEAPPTEAPAAGTQPGAAPATAEAPPAEEPGTPTQETPPSAATPSAPATGEAPPTAAEPDADVATAPAQDGELPEPPPAGVNEVLAPKLQSVESAVIIRRGDSLWRISRRVYGRGVRYSTIYLANQTQIEDPDRIWPGQVFKVPEKAADGEEADYSTLGDSLTTLPKENPQ